jgi:hypothetical protein
VRIRIPVTQTVASDLARHLGDAVRMQLGTITVSWWIIRSIEVQPGTERMFAVLEATEEP